MSQETPPNMISLHGIVIVNVELKMNQALEIMQDPYADPNVLERWKDVVHSYMKRVPDGMTPAAHMASAIVAADLFVASIDDRISRKPTRIRSASSSATDESLATGQGADVAVDATPATDQSV